MATIPSTTTCGESMGVARCCRNSQISAIPAYLFGIPIRMKYGLDRGIFHNKWNKSGNWILAILRIGSKNAGVAVVELHYLTRTFVRQISVIITFVVVGVGSLFDPLFPSMSWSICFSSFPVRTLLTIVPPKVSRYLSPTVSSLD